MPVASEKLSRAETRAKRREEARLARQEFWPTAKFIVRLLLKTDPLTIFLKVVSLVMNSASWALFNTFFIANFFDRLQAGDAISPGSVFMLLGGMTLLLALAGFTVAF